MTKIFFNKVSVGCYFEKKGWFLKDGEHIHVVNLGAGTYKDPNNTGEISDSYWFIIGPIMLSLMWKLRNPNQK